MSKDVVARLNREIVKTLNDPETHAAILKQGEEPTPSTPRCSFALGRRTYRCGGGRREMT